MTDDGPASASGGPSPTAGAVGGASGDAGVEFRRAVAAYAVVHALAGEPLAGLGFPLELSQVASVAIETDEHADDVRVRLTSGCMAQLQAKLTLRGGKPLKTAVEQWSRAAQAGLDPERDRLVIVAGAISGPMQLLAHVLDRLRTDEPGALTQGEQEQLDKIVALTPELTGQQRDVMLRCGVITQLDVVEEDSTTAASARTLLRQVVAATQTTKAWRSSCIRLAESAGSEAASALKAGYASSSRTGSRSSPVPHRPEKPH